MQIPLKATNERVPLSERVLKHRWFLVAVIALPAMYLLLSPISLSRLLEFCPQKLSGTQSVPKSIFGAQAEETKFKAPSGCLLYGLFFLRPGSQYTVLVHHGQGNLVTHMGLARTAYMSGCSVLIYDYEGFGLSEGAPSNLALLSDGEAAFDYLVKNKHTLPERIINLGASLGTGVASHVAMKKPCAAVMLISPYTSINQVGREKFPFFCFYPSVLYPHPDIGATEFIRNNKTVPCVLIHGEKDPLISVNHSLTLEKLASAPCHLIVIKGAHHGDFSTVFLSQQIKGLINQVDARR